MQKGSLVGSAIILLFLLAGIANVFTGIFGPAWYKGHTQNSTIGLWSNICQSVSENSTCVDGLQSLINIDSDLGIIFALMSATLAFAFLGLITTISMCCCHGHRKTWHCCSVINIVFLLTSDILVFGALGYNEYILDSNTKEFKRGWSLAAAWVGAACLLLAGIASFVILCKGNKEQEDCSIATKTSTSRYNYNKRDGLEMADIRPRVAKLPFWNK